MAERLFRAIGREDMLADPQFRRRHWGENTAEVLGALGLDRAAIDGLARDGIVGLAGDMP
jgi:hypothetical protein